MLLLVAMALATPESGPNLFERSLAKDCGTQVLRQARVQTIHGDSRTLIYDERLPSKQVSCLLAWAASWHGRIVNGVDTYASKRYPLGPYDIPPELKRRP